MKIDGLALEPVCHRLARPLVTGAGRLETRPGFRVRMREASGAVGRGEALPLPAAGTEGLAAAAAALERARHVLVGGDGSIDVLLARAARACRGAPAARCALDLALHELEALRLGVPLARALAAAPSSFVRTGALLGAGDAIEPAQDAVAHGFVTLKLKVGTPDEACRSVAELRRALGSAPILRLDANGAWTRAGARAALARLAALDAELVEQPLPAGDLEGLGALASGASTPIAADESLATSRGRAALIAGGLAHAAVLKPMVLGGLRPCLELARAASGRGVRSYVTTTFDGPLATCAAIHLAAALPATDLAHGLATAEWMAEPFPPSLLPQGGELRVPSGAGLGIEG